jgi:hypothetical protein
MLPSEWQRLNKVEYAKKMVEIQQGKMQMASELDRMKTFH